ncbi:MAG TPA: DUF3631 domain-containing protein [Acetobacteraceae bacterium]|nr:DUF3631 domain-containing protein [Acetobacteraceae bacterium]
MSDTTVVAAVSDDPDALYRGFRARAAALPVGSVGAADALTADIAASAVSETTFKPLAAAIAKTTDLDKDALYKRMTKARGTYQAAADDSGSGDGETALTAAVKPKPLATALDAIKLVVRRQVWCSDAAADAIVLWIAGTYGYNAADVFPRLAITSEMRRCGKSTLLGTIAHLAFDSEMADNISPAAMFRMIAAKSMTLLIDELDSFGKEDSGLRNILNAGYARNGAVKRVEPTPDGKSYVVTNFPCFAPVVIAGIGGLPDTVIDRSIVIRLQRAPRADTSRQRHLRLRELVRYRVAVVPHLLAHADAITAAIETGAVNLPNGLNDRALDNWDALLAVAELAAGMWPARAMQAAAILSGTTDEPHGLVEKLLQDIREIVEAPRRHALNQWREWIAQGSKQPWPGRATQQQWPAVIRTCDLMQRLLEMTHRPWQEANRGRPITERWLADRLRGLGVAPDRGRVLPWGFDVNGEPAPLAQGAPARSKLPMARTYAIADLRAAWKRCL